MDFRKANSIFVILAVIGIIVLLPFLFLRNFDSVLLFPGLAILVAGLIIRFAFCRCPKCRGSLYRHNFFTQKYCPYCGEDLEPETHDDNND